MDKRGFTIFEIVIALALVIFLYATIFPAMHLSDQRIALEEQKYFSVQDIKLDLFPMISFTEENLISSTTVLVNPIGVLSKELQDSRLIQSVRATSTYAYTADVFDIKHSIGASTCNIIPKNSFNYRIAATYTLPPSFQPESIDILNDYLYIAGRSFDTNGTDPDFYIFDIASTTLPVIVGSARVSNAGSGVAAIHAIDGRVFAAVRSTRYPLMMIDVTNPSTPKKVFEYQISTSSSVTGYGQGNVLYYYDDKIYLGLTKSTSSEFLVFSYDRNASTTPKYLGGFETNTQINAIRLKETIAYVATPDQKQVRILDVADPHHIQEKGFISAPGFSVQDGKSLSIVGNTLYVGRTVGGFDNPNNHEIFSYDISNHLNPILLSSVNVAASINSLVTDHGALVAFIGSPKPQLSFFGLFGQELFKKQKEFTISDTIGSFDCEDNTIIYVEMHNPKITIITH